LSKVTIKQTGGKYIDTLLCTAARGLERKRLAK